MYHTTWRNTFRKKKLTKFLFKVKNHVATDSPNVFMNSSKFSLWPSLYFLFKKSSIIVAADEFVYVSQKLTFATRKPVDNWREVDDQPPAFSAKLHTQNPARVPVGEFRSYFLVTYDLLVAAWIENGRYAKTAYGRMLQGFFLWKWIFIVVINEMVFT